MKRLYVPFLGLATLLFLSSSVYAQRGHSASATTPGATPTSSHGDSSSHSGNSGSIDSGRKAPDQLLSQNTKLSDNLSRLLPTGVTPQQACNGFKNLGQCVAAIHVSHNLGVDFNALKCDMTGKAETSAAACPTTTSSKRLSLGQAIDTLKPGTDSKSEADTAMKQAHQDIKGSGS